MAYLFDPIFDAMDSNGFPSSGATASFYLSGTLTPTPVYSSGALTTPLSNPVIADSAGRFTGIYLDPSIQYRVIVRTAGGSTIVDREISSGSGQVVLDPITTPAQIASGISAPQVTPTARALSARLAKGMDINAFDFGVKCDGITDDAPAMNALIQAVGARGGGTIKIPCDLTGNGRFMRINSPIDNNVPGVLIEGPVGGHNALSWAPYGLIIRPQFNGTALKHRSPRGATNRKYYGGGFKNLSVQGSYTGSGSSQILLEVDMVNSGVYHVNLLNSAGPMCAKFTAGDGLDLTNLDSGSTQFIDMDMVCSQFAGREDGFTVGNPYAHGLVLEGTETHNQSLWTGCKLLTQMVNGKGIWAKNMDTINFEEWESYDDSTGTGLNELCEWRVGTGGTATTTYPLIFSASPAGPAFTAEGTYTVRNNAFDSYRMTKLGSGYVTPPTVTFGGGSGLVGASATAVILPGTDYVAFLSNLRGGSGGTNTTLFNMTFNGPGTGAAGVFRVGPTAVALGTSHTITSAGSGGTDGTYGLVPFGIGQYIRGTYTVTGGVLTMVNITEGGVGVIGQPSMVYPAFPSGSQPAVTWTLTNGVTWYELTGATPSGYSAPYPLVFQTGGGNGASGYFRVAGGAVAEVVLTDPGTGYTSAPTIDLSACPGLTGASVTATLTTSPVSGFGILTPGSGGTNGTFALAFSGGGGAGAAGTFIVAGGVVTAVRLSNPGSGYTSAPSVSFAASAGLSGAAIAAKITPRGIASLSIVSPGAGGANRGSSVSFAASAGLTGAAAKPVIGAIGLWGEAGGTDNARLQGCQYLSVGLWSVGSQSYLAGKNWPGANTIQAYTSQFFPEAIPASSLTIDRFNGGNAIPTPIAGRDAMLVMTDDIGTTTGANIVSAITSPTLSGARVGRDYINNFSQAYLPGLFASGYGTEIPLMLGFDYDNWAFESGSFTTARLRPINGVHTDFQIWSNLLNIGSLQWLGNASLTLLSQGYMGLYNPTQHWTRIARWGSANDDGTGARVDRVADVGLFSTGSGNTSFGFNAGNALRVQLAAGQGNTIVGSDAGTLVVANSRNTYFGREAGKIATLNDNTALGFQAGLTVSTGQQNTLVGAFAGDALTTGSNNIVIGYNLDVDSGTANDQINIGGVYFHNRLLYTERTDPAAPATNQAVVYARDNGGGKTQLCVRFNTGAIQVLATEP